MQLYCGTESNEGVFFGACIPCDGVLVAEGPPEKYAPMKIDAASVTGEPMAETKRVGDMVLAGTTVMSGEQEMQATATGERSLWVRPLSLSTKWVRRVAS